MRANFSQEINTLRKTRKLILEACVFQGNGEAVSLSRQGNAVSARSADATGLSWPHRRPVKRQGHAGLVNNEADLPRLPAPTCGLPPHRAAARQTALRTAASAVRTDSRRPPSRSDGDLSQNLTRVRDRENAWNGSMSASRAGGTNGCWFALERAHLMARAGPSKVASMPSPAVRTSWRPSYTMST